MIAREQGGPGCGSLKRPAALLFALLPGSDGCERRRLGTLVASDDGFCEVAVIELIGSERGAR